MIEKALLIKTDLAIVQVGYDIQNEVVSVLGGIL